MTSQSQPPTPVRVPKTATTYTPATQDPDLRSQINTVLLRDGHVEKIQATLHQALHAHPSNWPSAVSAHALALLRSGECTTFPKLMDRVLADIRRDTEEDARRNRAITRPSSSTAANPLRGNNTANRAAAKMMGSVNGVAEGRAALGTGGSVVEGGRPSLALPKVVVDEGVRVTRECLELVCEIEE